MPPAEVAQATQEEHGLLHEAGEIVDRVQRCRRCGLDLPVSPAGGGFQVGGFVEHRRDADGQRMGWVRSPDASAFPWCDDPATG